MAGRITKNELNQSLKNEIESKASQLDLEGLGTNLQEFADQTSSHLVQNANKAHGGVKNALVVLNANQSVPNDAWTKIAFNHVIRQNGNFFNASSPGDFVVPAGVSLVRLSGVCFFTNNASGTRRFTFLKNGNLDFRLYGGFYLNAVSGTDTGIIITSPIISVVPGDVLSFHVRQNSGGSLAVFSTISSLQIEVIE